MSITEQVLIFLHIIGHNVRFHVTGSQFHRSIKTVHRYFKVILRRVPKVYRALIRLPSEDTSSEIRDSRSCEDLCNFKPLCLSMVHMFVHPCHLKYKKGFVVAKMEPRKMLLACCVIHNHIMGVDLADYIMEAAMKQVESNGSQQETQPRRDSIEDSRVWNAKKDEICQAMWPDYTRIMSKGKEKVGSKQFQWLPPMHMTMLTILAEEAVKDNKPSNTFKAGSFATTAKAISNQFGVECHFSYVENHMRTLRTIWSTIQALCKKSGFGWDDNLKMITCDAKTYQEEVMVHCKHVEYLNKRIEMYDELAIVVGKYMTIGSFAKLYVDIDTEQDHGESAEMVANNGEEGVVDKGMNVLKEIAVTLKEINWVPVDYTNLYSEVMAMAADGYSEDMLAIAFDYLCENKKAARKFLAKNAKLRKFWMDNYLFTQL
ncbi:hypothetical protein ACB092_01G248100 [Castanea dentata]